MDKRYQKSHQLIIQSLLDLLSKKSMNEISITEIANNANINRKTFYSHFENINDVLEQIQEDFLEESFKISKKCVPNSLENHKQSLQEFLDIILRNKEFHIHIIQSGWYHTSYKKVLHAMIGKTEESFGDMDNDQRMVIQFQSKFVWYGFIYSLCDWLTGETNMSREEFVEHVAPLGFKIRTQMEQQL